MQDSRHQVAAVPKVTAPLVDTRTIGKAPTFTGEQRKWPEWSFQFTPYMGSVNPKSIEPQRWAATEEDKITVAAVAEQSFEEHNPQLHLAFAQQCQGKMQLRIVLLETLFRHCRDCDLVFLRRSPTLWFYRLGIHGSHVRCKLK